MSNPMFSIIVPTHNGADRLPVSLGSVLKQTYDNYELIVVCDACNDNSAEVAESYGAIVINVDYQRDGLARNAGIDRATGDWILFLDDDDWYLHEYCFELLAGQVGKHGEDVLDFSFVWKGEGYKKPSEEDMFVMVWSRAWRRSFIGDNRFDDCPYSSDNHFFYRMIQSNRNVKIHFWDMPIYYYNYLREGSLSWMFKQKTLLDIIMTHYNEPWEIGKPFFDMLSHQRIADIEKVNIVLVQDGKEGALDWKNLLSQYNFHVSVVTIDHAGTASARNAGMQYAKSEWITFIDFDDMLSDVCSLNLILNLFPTDECDIIWGKYVVEMIWRKGLPYLQTVDVPNFINTIGKLYRRDFLINKNIKFDTALEYTYDYAFNAVCLTETPPFRIKTLTTEIYPFMKTYRRGSLHATEDYYRKAGTRLFEANIRIANTLRERGYHDEYVKFLAKALCFAYYSIYSPDTGDYPGISDNAVKAFLDKYRNEVMSVPDTDMEVMLDEAQTTIMNVIQRLYNEYKHLEYYIINDSISFKDWVKKIDGTPSIAGHIQEAPKENKIHALPKLMQQQKRQPRVVVYCGTPNVYKDMVTSCKSMLVNTPIDKVYFLTEDDVFPEDLPDIVETINVRDQKYFPEGGPNFDNAWTYMCMMRAAYPEIFRDYSKILSLDIDIIIDDNVSDLWDYDLTDYFLAGVPEKQRQKTEEDPLYVNFGVVMMNLDKLRAENKQQEIIDVLNTRKVDCPEQTAYNEACAYHILELPPEFNSTVYSHITGRAERERILHYAGQTFWKHYSNVKHYADMPWEQVMKEQNALKEREANA